MKRQRNTTQMKEQTRNTEVQINEEEIDKLPEKEFRVMTVKMTKILEDKMKKMQESINKDLERLKNEHTETNNTITEIKNTPEGINSRISKAEKQTSELEDKMVKIISEDQNKVKGMKRTEDSLRDLWDYIKPTNFQIIGVPEEEEEKKKGHEKSFDEIIVENFSNIEKEIVNQVQEAQSVPYRINPRRNMPRYILIKLTKKEY